MLCLPSFRSAHSGRICQVLLLGILFAAPLFLTSCIKESVSTEAASVIHVGEKAPLFTTTWLDSTVLSLEEQQGKVILLTFFSIQCPQCRKELAEVQKEIIDPYRCDQFIFIPISRGESRQELLDFCKKNGYTFPIGLDTDRTIYSLYAKLYVPHTFLIAPNGQVAMIDVEGSFTQSAPLHRKIKELLQTVAAKPDAL